MRVVFAWSAPVIRVIAHDEAFTLSLFIGLAVLLVALLDRMISKVFLRRTR
jgi:hypothetical protein